MSYYHQIVKTEKNLVMNREIVFKKNVNYLLCMPSSNLYEKINFNTPN